MTVSAMEKVPNIKNIANLENHNFKLKKSETIEEALIPEPYTCILGTFKTRLLWMNIFAMTALHLSAIISLFQVHKAKNPLAIIIFSYVSAYTLILGVTGGAHRLWTHRSYKAKKPLRIMLMLLFSGSMQNSLHDWARNHRMHHKFSDTDADPHNSRRGFFFCHVGWLLMRKHPEIKRRGTCMDMSDILADPVIQFHQKYYYILAVLMGFVVPTIIPPLLWGESWLISAGAFFVRYVALLNFTWFVNSIAHMWGTRPYDKEICPVEASSLILFSNGEYWHNFHHSFPWDYQASELGGYFSNSTAFWLDQFAKIGWVYDRKKASKEIVRKTTQKIGDGTHPFWGEVEMPSSFNMSVQRG